MAPSYTPWRVSALAWRTNLFAVAIYVYRTILAVTGIIIMSHILRVFMLHLESNSFVRDTFVRSGHETLASYILQTIIIERVMRRICRSVIEYFNYSFSVEYINIVGYVIALIVSFFALWGFLMVIRSIKKIPVIKYSFGF